VPPTRTLVGIGASIALLAGSVGAVTGALVANQADESPGTVTVIGADPADVAERPPDSVAGVAAAVVASVVSVSAGQATGSGFVISSDGYVVTNNHVVARAADQGSIELGFPDGSIVPAEIVGRPTRTRGHRHERHRLGPGPAGHGRRARRDVVHQRAADRRCDQPR
jgi:S1-C subfamily serine protease